MSTAHKQTIAFTVQQASYLRQESASLHISVADLVRRIVDAHRSDDNKNSLGDVPATYDYPWQRPASRINSAQWLKKQKAKISAGPLVFLDTKIKDLDLPTRIVRALTERLELIRYEEMVRVSDKTLLDYQNLGHKSVAEMRTFIAKCEMCGPVQWTQSPEFFAMENVVGRVCD